MKMQKAAPVMIDCDPGIDDAIALLLGFAHDAWEIRGITTVAGNVGLSYTTRNALGILELIGASCPVHQGAEKPLCGPGIDAADVHGSDGLHGVALPPTKRRVSGEAAWDAIYRESVAAEGALEVITLGPLTNLAIAFAKYPDLPQRIKRMVIMGGSATVGNVTPVAEFNILADVEAAHMVLNSRATLHICGLDVCHQAYLTTAELDAIGGFGTPQARFFRDVAQGGLNWAQTHGIPGVPMYDPCTVLYAGYPHLFQSQPVWMGVERRGKITRGKTVTDLYSEVKLLPNATLVTEVERPAFVAQVAHLMQRY